MGTGPFPKSVKDPASIRQAAVSAQKGFKAAGKGPGTAAGAFKGMSPRTAMEPMRKGLGA